ncbi:hypothetical protein AJ88_46830 [Mesorhizobium amorphae CCBAU 01583]|nr:hypothetical protein AJ88_46830 [Mesorhizobium amorphae CCBAU 01583]
MPEDVLCSKRNNGRTMKLLSKLWQRTLIEWKRPASYVSPLSTWLRPGLNKKGIGHLQKLGEKDLAWDDSIG